MALNCIELFPGEILIEIFKYLSPKMLKTCCAVSKRWNTIIDSSRQFMENFELVLDHKNSTEYQTMPIRQNYQAIKFQTLSMNKELIRRALSIDSCSLNSLELDLCNLALHEFADVLKNLPVLMHLHLKFLMLKDKNESSSEAIEAAKLKLLTLQITGHLSITYEKLFSTFDVNTLRYLKLGTYPDRNIECRVHCRGIINFIQQQESLEQLYLNYRETTAFFNDPQIFDMKFRLKFLNIKGGNIENVEKFCSFVSIHKDTLETLKLFIMQEECNQSELYEYIWNNLSLKTIDASGLEFDREWDDSLVLNPEFADQYLPKFPVESIKLFRFDEGNFSPNYFNIFISSLESVKQLDLERVKFDDIGGVSPWINIIELISNNMKNLTVLKMPRECDISILAPEVISFPKLEELNMRNINNEAVSPFIRRHSRTLQKISFEWMEQDFMDSILDEIFNCDNLKLISLNTEQTNDLSSHKSLISRTRELSNTLSMFNRLDMRTKRNREWHLIFTCTLNKYTYKFPDDIAYWNQHHSVWMNQGDPKKEDFM